MGIRNWAEIVPGGESSAAIAERVTKAAPPVIVGSGANTVHLSGNVADGRPMYEIKALAANISSGFAPTTTTTTGATNVKVLTLATGLVFGDTIEFGPVGNPYAVATILRISGSTVTLDKSFSSTSGDVVRISDSSSAYMDYGALIESCEAGWTGTNCVVTHSTARKTEGISSVKIVNQYGLADGSGTGITKHDLTAQKTGLTFDITNYQTISCWVYVEAPTSYESLNNIQVYWTLTDGGTNGVRFDFKITKANEWQKLTFLRSTENAPIGGAIQYAGLTTVKLVVKDLCLPTANTSFVMRVDNFRMNVQSKPIFLITMDDQWETQASLAAPILDAYDVKASFAVISDLVQGRADGGTNGGTAVYATEAQLQAMYGNGHAMFRHSKTHPKMRSTVDPLSVGPSAWQMLRLTTTAGALSGNFTITCPASKSPTGVAITTANIAYSSVIATLESNIKSAIQTAGIAYTGSTTVTTSATSATQTVGSTTGMAANQWIRFRTITGYTSVQIDSVTDGTHVVLKNSITTYTTQPITGWLVRCYAVAASPASASVEINCESDAILLTCTDVSLSGTGKAIAIGWAYDSEGVKREYDTCGAYLASTSSGKTPWTRNNSHLAIAYPYGEHETVGGASPSNITDVKFHQGIIENSDYPCMIARSTNIPAQGAPSTWHGGANNDGRLGMLQIDGSGTSARKTALQILQQVNRAMKFGGGACALMYHKFVAAGSTPDSSVLEANIVDFEETVKALAQLRDAGVIELMTIGEYYEGLNIPV